MKHVMWTLFLLFTLSCLATVAPAQYKRTVSYRDSLSAQTGHPAAAAAVLRGYGDFKYLTTDIIGYPGKYLTATLPNIGDSVKLQGMTIRFGTDTNWFNIPYIRTISGINTAKGSVEQRDTILTNGWATDVGFNAGQGTSYTYRWDFTKYDFGVYRVVLGKQDTGKVYLDWTLKGGF